MTIQDNPIVLAFLTDLAAYPDGTAPSAADSWVEVIDGTAQDGGQVDQFGDDQIDRALEWSPIEHWDALRNEAREYLIAVANTGA